MMSAGFPMLTLLLLAGVVFLLATVALVVAILLIRRGQPARGFPVEIQNTREEGKP